ncbi:hypothetical protein [Aurantiacibacter spongiae]|uniref:Uncharacterized protein n=1 Tax=Aurantiacibacter spongiae TaxID=2488860 RepID=A0A3N5CRU2_9SPHN|nr:hypothetical protein [Aurantiacibacter spongiae]RPF71066.1 hypothetical protein EG799_05140 [Aurantiacibacter spongiae]
MTETLRVAVSILRDRTLSDEEKERLLRRQSVEAFGLVATVTAALAATFLAAAAPVAVAEMAGWLDWRGFLAFSLRPAVVVATVAVFAAAPWLRSRLPTN